MGGAQEAERCHRLTFHQPSPVPGTERGQVPSTEKYPGSRGDTDSRVHNLLLISSSTAYK